MKFDRSSGLLIHPTSFPGKYGIGDLGPEAFKFIDFLANSNQKLWQILPLGPTGYGDSPYSCFSAFAGNPLLISLEKLMDDELLTPSDLNDVPDFPKEKVDYSWVTSYKLPKLTLVWERFQKKGKSTLWDEFHAFCDQQNWWLHDYAMFTALKEAHDGASWTKWEKGAAMRDPQALEDWHDRLGNKVGQYKFWQFLFFRQWWELKTYCWGKGIKVIGDIPIYVAHDSSDVWAQPHLYHLDEKGNSKIVAGVPPDYFSKTGQLWGNPIYNWDRMAEDGYQWWIARFRQIFTCVDIVRLDHFRGFEAYWAVSAKEKTAENGKWVKGPGTRFFDVLASTFGEFAIIAENLGVITKQVEALRMRYEFPGMAILQFAFGSDADSIDLPHNYPQNIVAYTGTHDNDTSMGWWDGSTEGTTRTQAQVEKEKAYALKYLNTDGKEMHWTLIRTLMASVADTVVFPVQDILGLGTKARMNQPGRPKGNWQWRMQEGQLTEKIKDRLVDLTETYGRVEIEKEETESEPEVIPE
jgi:4-alpha-glucanotransferase